MQTAADHVITKCGGFKRVSEWLGLDLSTVYRFTYPRENGGTGGVIPAQHQATLLAKARDADVDLKPDDFFVTGADVSPPITPSHQPNHPVGADK